MISFRKAFYRAFIPAILSLILLVGFGSLNLLAGDNVNSSSEDSKNYAPPPSSSSTSPSDVNYSAFLTRLPSEATETGVDTRRDEEAPGNIQQYIEEQEGEPLIDISRFQIDPS